MPLLGWVAPIMLLLLPLLSFANSSYESCLAEQVQKSEDNLSAAEIKKTCEDLPAADTKVAQRPLVISAHKPSYFLLSNWNSPSSGINPFMDDGMTSLDDIEMKFQISFKVPIIRNLFVQNTDAYFAYTTQSWWQLFNSELSSPFRETNYEPELFVRNFSNYALPFDITLTGWSIGINHQSNGRSEPLSRSWNRTLGQLDFKINEDLMVLLRIWDRIDEGSADDDNPDIEDFLGFGDVRAIWTHDESIYTAMFRQGKEENAIELTWSYPITPVFRVYSQIYSGYGESLIDYDRDVSRFAFGISLNDYPTNGLYN